MICDRILGHLDDPAFASALKTCERDTIELRWQDCDRRFLRTVSRAGRTVGMLLPVGSRLRQGDVVHVDPSLIVSVVVLPAPVLVIPIESAQQSASIAYELGGLHCPVQFTKTQIVVPAEEPLEAFLIRRAIPFVSQLRVFQPVDLPGSNVGLALDFQISTRP